MKAKITKNEFEREWTSTDGATSYKFIVEFDNGEKGEYWQKTKENKHPVGSEEEFETELTDNGFKKIKWHNNKPNFMKSPARNPEEEAKRQLWIVRQSSLKGAVELAANGKIHCDEILKVSEVFTDWVMGSTPARPLNEPTDKMPF